MAQCRCGEPVERIVVKSDDGRSEDVLDLEVGPGSTGTVVEVRADGAQVFGVKHVGRRIHSCPPSTKKPIGKPVAKESAHVVAS